MRRDARWVHAAKVALGATAIVGAVAVVMALVANLLIVDRLTHSMDVRMSSQLTVAEQALSIPGQPVSLNPSIGDLDDAPTFVWQVSPTGKVTSLTGAAPRLPRHAWDQGQVTLPVAGTTFRFDAIPSRGGWLVAGESVVKLGENRADLLVAEALLGGLLLIVTFAGSFIIGLRASAPIEQIRRRQAEFTADASHELRTPLSVIEAEVDLALDRDRDGESYRSTLRRISSESDRLRTIVEDLLWLARADNDEAPGTSGRTADVAAIGNACLERFRAVADAASITLSDRGRPGTVGRIQADPDSVDRLVTVLLDNACRYAGNRGSVSLEVTGGDGQVVLTVDDSGPGIPEEHRELVFDRFHRASDLPGGTGLGLAIADAVVRNSGGTWSIGTSPQGGARMQVSWREVSGPPGARGGDPGADRSGPVEPAPTRPLVPTTAGARATAR